MTPHGEEFLAFGGAIASSAIWSQFEKHRDRVLDRVRAAIVRPSIAPVTEEYTVFRVHELKDADGQPWPSTSCARGQSNDS